MVEFPASISRIISIKRGRTFRCALLLLICLLSLSGTLFAQDERELPRLELGKPIEREFAGDAVHSYSIAITSGQYLNIVVDQHGIDVVVSLFDSNGKKIAEVDSPNGAQGPEPLYLITETTGNYRLEVRSLDKTAPLGRYEAKIVVLRTATVQDKNNAIFMQAEMLRGQGTPESIRAAIAKYQEAISVYRAAENRKGEAASLLRIGYAYGDLEDRPKALEFYEQALSAFRAINDKRGKINALLNGGLVCIDMGESQKAFAYFSEVLSIAGETGDHTLEALARNNLGATYIRLGERQKALDSYLLALPLLREVGDHATEATTLNNIGHLYNSLGENQKALDYYAQVLPLRRAAKDRSGEAVTLNNIGGVYNDLEQYREASDNFTSALSIFRKLKETHAEATTLHNLAGVYFRVGDKKLALESYEEALRLRRIVGDRGGEASTIHNIGKIYAELGDKQRASDNYSKALSLFRELKDPDNEAGTLYSLASLERDRGKLSESLNDIKAAIKIVEALRQNIGSNDLRSTYFASVQKFYELFIDVLMQLDKLDPTSGDAGIALQSSESKRARSLLETLNEARADIRVGVDLQLLQQSRSLQKQLNAGAQQQAALLKGQHTNEESSAVAKELERLSTEYQQVETKIRQTSPRYAALTQPQPLSLKEIQTQLLDNDSLLLEYSLGENRSYLWAVTSKSIASYELPKRAEIEGLARSVYSLLKDPKAWKATQSRGFGSMTELKRKQALSSLSDLNKLSRLVLTPVGTLLRNKRLVVVADGALQYIPFGALQTVRLNETRRSGRGYRPLILDHEIVNLPSASTLDVLRQEVKDRQPAAKTIAILADPVFESDDERINRGGKAASDKTTINATQVPSGEAVGVDRSAEESGLRTAGQKIPRLPGTRKEALQILALVPLSQRKDAFDFSANKEMAMSDELSKFRYVHFATHGFLNSVHPELSGLVFSLVDAKGGPVDGFVRAHELFNLKLSAELVVLSACQTGLGKEVRGEGLVGLTRGFMYAGAPRVVVSLWSVSDEATAVLMARFYRGMLRGKLRPAAALRSAQVSLMREPRWSSPFYWSAFTLQGEWK